MMQQQDALVLSLSDRRSPRARNCGIVKDCATPSWSSPTLTSTNLGGDFASSVVRRDGGDVHRGSATVSTLALTAISVGTSPFAPTFATASSQNQSDTISPRPQSQSRVTARSGAWALGLRDSTAASAAADEWGIESQGDDGSRSSERGPAGDGRDSAADGQCASAMDDQGSRRATPTPPRSAASSPAPPTGSLSRHEIEQPAQGPEQPAQGPEQPQQQQQLASGRPPLPPVPPPAPPPTRQARPQQQQLPPSPAAVRSANTSPAPAAPASPLGPAPRAAQGCPAPGALHTAAHPRGGAQSQPSHGPEAGSTSAAPCYPGDGVLRIRALPPRAAQPKPSFRTPRHEGTVLSIAGAASSLEHVLRPHPPQDPQHGAAGSHTEGERYGRLPKGFQRPRALQQLASSQSLQQSQAMSPTTSLSPVSTISPQSVISLAAYSCSNSGTLANSKVLSNLRTLGRLSQGNSSCSPTQSSARDNPSSRACSSVTTWHRNSPGLPTSASTSSLSEQKDAQLGPDIIQSVCGRGCESTVILGSSLGWSMFSRDASWTGGAQGNVAVPSALTSFHQSTEVSGMTLPCEPVLYVPGVLSSQQVDPDAQEVRREAQSRRGSSARAGSVVSTPDEDCGIPWWAVQQPPRLVVGPSGDRPRLRGPAGPGHAAEDHRPRGPRPPKVVGYD